MIEIDNLRRAAVLEAYEAIPSLDRHGELTRLILTEASMLADRYRYVQRHDVPHVRELVGLLDVLWQEIEMELSGPAASLDELGVA
jgi:hypothetical protein